MEININIKDSQLDGKARMTTTQTQDASDASEDAGAPKFDFGNEKSQDSLEFSEEMDPSEDTEAGAPAETLVKAIEEAQERMEKSGSGTNEDANVEITDDSDNADVGIDSIDAGGPPEFESLLDN